MKKIIYLLTFFGIFFVYNLNLKAAEATGFRCEYTFTVPKSNKSLNIIMEVKNVWPKLDKATVGVYYRSTDNSMKLLKGGASDYMGNHDQISLSTDVSNGWFEWGTIGIMNSFVNNGHKCPMMNMYHNTDFYTLTFNSFDDTNTYTSADEKNIKSYIFDENGKLIDSAQFLIGAGDNPLPQRKYRSCKYSPWADKRITGGGVDGTMIVFDFVTVYKPGLPPSGADYYIYVGMDNENYGPSSGKVEYKVTNFTNDLPIAAFPGTNGEIYNLKASLLNKIFYQDLSKITMTSPDGCPSNVQEEFNFYRNLETGQLEGTDDIDDAIENSTGGDVANGGGAYDPNGGMNAILGERPQLLDWGSGEVRCEVILGEGMLKTLGWFFMAIRIAAPLMLIVLSMIEFVKATTNADAMKVAISKSVKRAVAVAVIVVLPFIVNFIAKIFELDGLDCLTRIL